MVNIKPQSAFQTVVFLVLYEGPMMSYPLFHPENIQRILDASSKKRPCPSEGHFFNNVQAVFQGRISERLTQKVQKSMSQCPRSTAPCSLPPAGLMNQMLQHLHPNLRTLFLFLPLHVFRPFFRFFRKVH